MSCQLSWKYLSQKHLSIGLKNLFDSNFFARIFFNPISFFRPISFTPNSFGLIFLTQLLWTKIFRDPKICQNLFPLEIFEQMIIPSWAKSLTQNYLEFLWIQNFLACNRFGPTFFWTRHFLDQKRSLTRHFLPKIFLNLFFLTKNFKSICFFFTKLFLASLFLVLKFLGSIFLGPTLFGPNLFDQNLFGPKFFHLMLF